MIDIKKKRAAKQGLNGLLKWAAEIIDFNLRGYELWSIEPVSGCIDKVSGLNLFIFISLFSRYFTDTVSTPYRRIGYVSRYR